MDSTTGISVGLLSGLILAATSLPLNVVLRNACLRAVEQAPPNVTRRMIIRAEHTPEARGRISRRLVAALATPMFFLAVGCALIANAHIRRADERSTAITARMLARAVLEEGPGVVGDAGIPSAVKAARSLGYTAALQQKSADYGLVRTAGGVLELTAPLDSGSVTVRFHGSTVAALDVRPFLLAVLAVFIAALLGFLLGNSLTNDLYHATRRVQLLGTDAIMSGGTALMRPARFTVVAELGHAIETLAGRFRVFAKAQEGAIEAREAATRMRGLFFAAVSHDLKSPLNAILGFTELVRAEPLTDGQIESLDVIQSRAQELLALIETILDAARVEAGQLSLITDEVNFADLYAMALEKARQLSGDYPLQIWDDVEPELPPVLVDPTRVSRALATFMAYSVRATQGGKMWVRAEMEDPAHLRVDVDVPSQLHTPQQLEEMISPRQKPGPREHRGMALGLRLARALIELNRGHVRVIDRGAKGAMFCITLNTAEATRPGIGPALLKSHRNQKS